MSVNRAVLVIFLLGILHLQGQESIHTRSEGWKSYSPWQNYKERLYGVAVADLESEIKIDSIIHLASECSFEMGEHRSIDLLLESVSRTNNLNDKNSLFLKIANNYFEVKDYSRARYFYTQIPDPEIKQLGDQRNLFYKAYTFLLKKDFTSAESSLKAASDINGPVNAEVHYYSGICAYHQQRTEDAIKYFEKVEQHPSYSKLIPFYFAQIHFTNQEYQKVIELEKRLIGSNTKNEKTLYRIIGLSYLAQGNNTKALENLDQYASLSDKLTENEFYQLGKLHYDSGNLEEASHYLKEIAHQSSEVGQMSNYLLGAISLKLDQKNDARSAFKQASKLSFFKDVQNESQFLYYKLSADLGDEQTAINGFIRFNESNAYYVEAQSLLSEVLLNTNNNELAISTIENLESQTPQLLNAYQKLSYDAALQALEQENHTKANAYLLNAKQVGSSAQIKNQSVFWLGYMSNLKGDYQTSSTLLDEYLQSEDREYRFEANYYKAYQDVYTNKYDPALNNFEKSIAAFNSSKDDKGLFEDAIIRVADLHLINNNYEKALQFYDKAISNNVPQSDYIIFQQALTYGVVGRQFDKIANLEKLIKQYPRSEYKVRALYEIGEALVVIEKTNDAYKVFEGLTGQYPESSWAAKSWLRMGLIGFNQGDMESALRSYEKVIQNSDNPEDQREALLAMEEIYLKELNNADAYFKYLESEIGYEYEDITKDSISYEVAFEKYKEGNYDEAIVLFEKYRSNFKTGFFKDDALYYQAESYVLQKKYDLALPLYKKITGINESEHFESAIRKAALISYNHTLNFQDALNFYSQLIELQDSDKLEYLEAALYSAFKIERDEAIQNYALLVGDHPQSDPLSKSTAYFYLGKSYLRTNQVDGAIDAFNRVIRLSSNHRSAEASFLLAEIFYKKGDLEKAETLAFETTKRASKYPIYVARSLVLLGDIYKDKKDYLNASAAYETVIENFVDKQKIYNQAKMKLEALEKTISQDSKVIDESKQQIIAPDTLKYE